MRSRAVELGQEHLAFGLEADEGICLEFIGETGCDLAVSSLEDARQGIELLGVHQRDNTVSATVYVPSSKVESLIQKVEAYLDRDTRRETEASKARRRIPTFAWPSWKPSGWMSQVSCHLQALPSGGSMAQSRNHSRSQSTRCP